MGQTRKVPAMRRKTALATALSAVLSAVLGLALPSGALAQQGEESSPQPVVVELFTSQGCSSCPPADALLKQLAQRPGVIALALHVDYWDYIGWKDEFAQAKFSERQRGYAVAAGRRSIYTPEMIVNGVTDVVGARAMKLSAAIAEHAAVPSQVDLQLERNGDQVLVGAVADGAEGPFVVQLVRYTPLRETHITRGENAGKTLKYANVADEWSVLTRWDGADALAISADVDAADPVVIIVQRADSGAIVAAARLR